MWVLFWIAYILPVFFVLVYFWLYVMRFPKVSKVQKNLILQVIKINNTITFLYFKPIQKYFRIDLLPTEVRWGIEGLLLAWSTFFLSFAGGGVMGWGSYLLGGIGLILFIQLAIYFLTHPAYNLTDQKVDKIAKY